MAGNGNPQIRAIEIPKFGMTMEEGVIDQWLVKVGESFRKGDPLVTVESTKITNELEAPFDGTLRRIVADSGAELPVGALIGVSAPESVGDDEIDAFIAQHSPDAGDASAPAASPAPAPTPAAATATIPAPQPIGQPSVPAPQPAPAPTGDSYVVPDALKGTAAAVPATVHAKQLADELGIDLSRIEPTARGGRVSVADIEHAIRENGGSVPKQRATRVPPPRSQQDDSDVPATPVARRLAAELGVNLHDARATGRGGRVNKADVEAAARRLRIAEVEAAEGPAAARELEEGPEYEAIPFTSVRKVIAERLKASKLNSPHYGVETELDVGALLALRAQINDQVPGVHLSVNDVLVKAIAGALVRVPDVNVQFDEASKTILRFHHADVAIAVAAPSGLITPIVRHADEKSLSQISTEIRTLITKVKAGTITPDEFQGGTFSVSNLGMFGVTAFDAIINPPQAAILAVGTTRTVPKWNGEAFEPAHVITVTVSADHRVIDGALAAQFLAELKRLVEQPALLLA